VELRYESAITKDQRAARARNKNEVRDWFRLETPQITPQVQKDLNMLQLRNYMDPKRFYKTNDTKRAPKRFQIGTVVEGTGEFFSQRLTKKERKPTLVDQVLADREIRTYARRVYLDHQREKKNVIRISRRGQKRRANKGRK